MSGGPDSLGLVLLAREAGLRVEVHHVNHHTRASTSDEAAFVRRLCEEWGVDCVIHDVEVPGGANFEARARAARRGALPADAMTGHTMDDLAETVLLNMLRGAGVDGLSPMVRDATKPLLALRRAELAALVTGAGIEPVHDESNDDLRYRRNRVRHQLLPTMNELAERDVVPILARQADVLFEERSWLAALTRADRDIAIADVDCRELRDWPRARLRRWLRVRLARVDEGHDEHPPSAAEVERALEVIDGEAVATELSGGRRLSRRGRRLALEDDSTTLTSHG